MSANNLINQAFGRHFHRPIDKKFALDVLTYVQRFERKSSDHIDFLGSNLIGVYSFKFLKEDESTWLEEVLMIDDIDQLRKEIWEVPEAKQNFNTGSDAVNLSLLYITYRFLTTNDLAEEQKIRAAKACMDMLSYKMISSLQTRNFKYKADPEVALLVYEKLDNKFQLKRYGTWGAFVKGRTDIVLGTTSIHHNVIRDLEPDGKLVAMLNDIRTRWSSVIKILTSMFHDIKATKSRITKTSKFVLVEGEALLKEKSSKYTNAIEKILLMLPDKNGFVKEELVNVIPEILNTVNPVYLRSSLYFLSENVLAKHFEISRIVEDSLNFTLGLIRKEGIEIDSVPEIALRLKNALRSSRLNSSEYEKLKKELDVIIKHNDPRLNENAVISTRIGVIMYITLRALIN